MAKLLVQTHTLHDVPRGEVANEATLPGDTGPHVQAILDGTSEMIERTQTLPQIREPSQEVGEKFVAPPLRFVSMHYQCLGMHGYNRPDGTWVIGFLEDSSRIDEKITDFPIKPSNDDLIRIKEIQSKHQDNGYILCSPRTIIKLLLGSEQLVEHIQNDDEVGYFRFHIDGASIWLVAHKDYRDFPKYLAGEAS